MANEDYSKPVVYFYIDDNGKIAYIGKANGTIDKRVKAHSIEKPFLDCKCEFDIRYQVFDKVQDMDIAEEVYIKSFKPYLNIIYNTSEFFQKVDLNVYKLPKYNPITLPFLRELYAKLEYFSKYYNDAEKEIRIILSIIKEICGEECQISDDISLFKNPRKAGRKWRLTNEEKNKMYQMINEKKSADEIAKEMKLSRWYVYKILKRTRNIV